jgi:hypothetical protein
MVLVALWRDHNKRDAAQDRARNRLPTRPAQLTLTELDRACDEESLRQTRGCSHRGRGGMPMVERSFGISATFARAPGGTCEKAPPGEGGLSRSC